MTILILNRSAMSYSAYHEWLCPPPGEGLAYYTAPGRRDLPPARQAEADARYEEIREYADYDTSDALERDALALHARAPITGIVALSEWDQIRAGRLRERLGLPGTDEATALAYRDKLVMKRHLSEAGVPVTPFADLRHALDLVGFAEARGFPILVKPRLLAASKGLHAIADMDALRAFAATGFGASVEARPLQLAEAMVDIAEEYHVDGIVVDGALRFAWPSRYVGATTGFESDAMFGSVMLAPGNPRTRHLIALTEAAIAALPALGTSTFHAEIFETRDGALLVNEIAARTGGFRVNDHVRAAFGFWPNREWARLQAGLGAQAEAIPGRDARPDPLAGYLLLRPRPGTLAEIPGESPFPWTYDYRTHAAPGERFAAGDSSVSQLASAVVTGATETQVRARLTELYDWFYRALRMAPPARADAEETA